MTEIEFLKKIKDWIFIDERGWHCVAKDTPPDILATIRAYNEKYRESPNSDIIEIIE